MTDPVSRAEMKEHFSHMRESLSDIKTTMGAVVLIQEDVAVIKSQVKDVRTDIKANENLSTKNKVKIQTICTNQKWMGRIFGTVQALALALLGIFFNFKK